jgi:hypothetical protein
VATTLARADNLVHYTATDVAKVQSDSGRKDPQLDAEQELPDAIDNRRKLLTQYLFGEELQSQTTRPWHRPQA